MVDTPARRTPPTLDDVVAAAEAAGRPLETWQVDLLRGLWPGTRGTCGAYAYIDGGAGATVSCELPAGHRTPGHRSTVDVEVENGAVLQASITWQDVVTRPAAP